MANVYVNGAGAKSYRVTESADTAIGRVNETIKRGDKFVWFTRAEDRHLGLIADNITVIVDPVEAT